MSPMNNAAICLLTLTLATVPLTGWSAAAKGRLGYEIQSVACGELVTATSGTELCHVVDVTGNSSYAQVTLFFGARVGADALVLGGSGRIGVLVTLKVPYDSKGSPDYTAVKRLLPEIQNHPEIKKLKGSERINKVILKDLPIKPASPEMKKKLTASEKFGSDGKKPTGPTATR